MRASLTARPPAAGDKAVAELAVLLAKALDTSSMECPHCERRMPVPTGDPRIAAQLLAALEALQMSPRSRIRAHRGEAKNASDPANPLDELAVARARIGRTAAVDSGPP